MRQVWPWPDALRGSAFDLASRASRAPPGFIGQMPREWQPACRALCYPAPRASIGVSAVALLTRDASSAAPVPIRRKLAMTPIAAHHAQKTPSRALLAAMIFPTAVCVPLPRCAATSRVPTRAALTRMHARAR